MDLFVLFLFTFITVLNFVEGQYFPRQIMPINTQQQQQQQQQQFNPFLSNYQLMKMQQQIQQQQQQMLQAAAMFQQPQMQRTQQGILQSPAVAGDISNPNFQQQQQSRSIPFQVSFNGGQKKNEQVATPFNGGGLIPLTEKLLDSNSEQLPSSVGNVKRDNSLLSENIQQQQPQLQSTLSPPQIESLPPFLQGAPKEIIDEFKRILRQPQLSYDAKVQQVQALVNTLSPDRQQLYQQFMGQQNQLETTPSSTILSPSPQLLHRQPTRSPSRMPQRSPPGDDGFTMISKILQDESIPENERWKQIVGIYGEAEPRVKNENPFAFDGIVN